jgi:hypothetical protein
MQLTAVFESWHIGDGNYPPLSRGDLVRLSFEMEVEKKVTPTNDETGLVHLGGAEYNGTAVVLRGYERDHMALVVFEAGAFRFYSQSDAVRKLKAGQRVRLGGTLLLDHYSWVEYWNEYENPPNLFYTLRVSAIRKVPIPERFVSRHDKGKAHPTRVALADCENVQELETMEGQPFDEEFYIIDFDDRGVANERVPLTFSSAPAA